MLIFAEGARLLENAIAFSSCVGRFEDVNQCPAGGRDRGDPAGALAPRRLPEPPAESEAPRDRQRPPVPAVIIQRSFPLWSTNQQPSLTQPRD
ncbi:hypothetical protein [Bacillus sp. OK048]|uniref:hypothetical protein n=1 Tax=Bacillus sp. OK048 TaxID=1882761 RepID=UPI000B84D6F7|nr:hypothetical protein [Bacillus sp. OK048]